MTKVIDEIEPKSPAFAVVFPVRPFSLWNCAGLGVISGALIHGIMNWHLIFGPSSFDIVNFALLTIHVGTFGLILGTFLYQLIFWVFRCYNRKLIKSIEYQVALERCVQFLFGLCLGGYLVYRWKIMNDSAACIPKEYCPDSYLNRRMFEKKIELCDGKLCKAFFDRFPAFLQTFRTIAFGIFLQWMFERQNRLEISMTVYKAA